jgi:hypothetical protein
MSRSYNDSGLIAKRSYRLLAVGLTALAVFMASCHTASQVPMDDAYYWPDNAAPIRTAATQTTPSTPTTPASAIEYTNIQDTTVTIRIKR